VSGNQNRIEALEARVRELEAGDVEPTTAASEPKQTESPMTEDTQPEPESAISGDTGTDTNQAENEAGSVDVIDTTTESGVDPVVEPVTKDASGTKAPSITVEGKVEAVVSDTETTPVAESNFDPEVNQPPAKQTTAEEITVPETINQPVTTADTEPAAAPAVSVTE
jgi:hypothetical protein